MDISVKPAHRRRQTEPDSSKETTFTTMFHQTPEPHRIRQLNNLSPLRERFGQTPPDSPQSPASPIYQVRYKDYESAIEAIAQLESELNEFQQSSYELEKELEKELAVLEEGNDQLKEKNEQLTRELKDLQRSRFEAEQNATRTKEDLTRKLKSVEDELEKKNLKLVDIEILNDSIEQNERNLNVSYRELEDKFHSAQEKVVILETEVSETRDQLFKEQLNHQNTKNELEDLRIKFEELLKKQTAATFSQPPTSSSDHRSTATMSRSTSLRQLHTMIEHTRDMESKIDNIKLSLNKNQNLKIHRIKSATTTKISNTTITTTTPTAVSTPARPQRKRIPLSPSSFKLSSLSGAKFDAMEAIEGSPNFKDEKPQKETDKKISFFGGKLTR